MHDIFSAFSLGDLLLNNRVVMAPMTRNRADAHGVPAAAMATYYAQRADSGLVISESTPISAQAIGYPFTPGLFSAAQVDGWRRVTDAVHAQGGRIFAQLQHCGRVSHPSMQPDGVAPVAPSAIRPQGSAVTYAGMQDFETPRALSVEDIHHVVSQFQSAAQRAKDAGFDGVEVHGANGYLIDQFLRDGSNHRTDTYGGTPTRRLTFLMDVINAVAEVWPRHRIGVRLSPENRFNDMFDSSPAAHFEFFAAELGQAQLAYLHVLEGDMMTRTAALDYRALRNRFGGVYIANNGYDKARATVAIQNGDADMVAFGSAFLANPDLVSRLKQGWPLNSPDYDTYYVGGECGYTDYPVFNPTESLTT